ncbi:MAG: DUF4097 domain-containing protein [Acidobacteria bacterium]|nr:DUF4097 domain-containing protein [Acidobacteriota bacterium]
MKNETLTNHSRPRGTLLIALIALLLALPAAGVETQIRRSFEVRAGGTLELDTDRGSIEIRTHDAPTVDVLVTMDARTRDESEAKEMFEDFDVSFHPSVADLRIEGDDRSPRSRGWFNFRGGSNAFRVRWTVTVPTRYTLDLRTSGGSISVHDLNGDVDARTSGGGLKFGRIEGRVRARSSGGSISIEETGGRVDVSTSGGGIAIARARGDVRAHTSGGSIRVDEVFGTIDAVTSGGSITASLSSQPTHDCRLSTSGGSVNVRLDPSIALNLDARSSGGRVSADIPVTIRGTMGKNRLQGTINGGGPELVLRTSGGGISIRGQ